jgi:hypothetical protein
MRCRRSASQATPARQRPPPQIRRRTAPVPRRSPPRTCPHHSDSIAERNAPTTRVIVSTEATPWQPATSKRSAAAWLTRQHATHRPGSGSYRSTAPAPRRSPHRQCRLIRSERLRNAQLGGLPPSPAQVMCVSCLGRPGIRSRPVRSVRPLADRSRGDHPVTLKGETARPIRTLGYGPVASGA